MNQFTHWLSNLFSGSLSGSLFGRPVFRRLLFIALIAIAVLGVAGTIWFVRLDHDIQARFAEKRFAPPVEFYSAPEVVQIGEKWPADYFESMFERKAYVKRAYGQSMQPGDFSVWSHAECDTLLKSNAPPAYDHCIAYINSSIHSPTEIANGAAPAPENPGQILAVTGDGFISGAFGVTTGAPLPGATLAPELFAQYYGDRPILRKVVSFQNGDVPPMCLNALLAIEDPQFYEHNGVSFRGLLRAVLTNLHAGGYAQGGSTITQQLVKNYFLTPERTLKRKLRELGMSFLVERRASKDDILETYINLIYMGQNGSFEVRGFAAASEHYLGKPLRSADLPECALLAAILNNPGFYNPFTHADRAMKRRSRVLDKMLEQKRITEADYKNAVATPLPERPGRLLTEPASYFVQSVRRQIEKLGLDETQGLRIYTTLNLRAQEAAQQAVRKGLDQLETTYKQLKKIKATGKNLEAVLISADPKTGAVQALVGGRGFLASPFNRALESHRQVGSVMKPFVYLTAFENMQPDGTPYTPLTLVKDEATTHKFEGQIWSPHNYEGTYNGPVPIFYALKESLNAATANLGIQVGLSNIVDLAARTGITAKIAPYPSLTLGAFELTPFEVLQSYSTLANLGSRTTLTLITKVENPNGHQLFAFAPDIQQVVSPESTAELVGTMKQTLISGTGRAAKLIGFTHPAAGKTGTTNDLKDAWFAGFTPEHAAIVWVGYDDNTPLGLTGALGALPIWATYMKNYAASFAPVDFAWPAGTESATIDVSEQKKLSVPEEKGGPLEPVTLIFKKGQVPRR